MLKFVSKVFNCYSFLFCGFAALARSCNGEGGQVGALALKKLGYFNAEGKRAFVNKGKGKVLFAAFVA